MVKRHAYLSVTALMTLSLLLSGATRLNRREATLHALNRLAFGPRPGQMEEVAKVGLRAWIDQQLHPDTIDDSDCGQRLQAFPDITKTAFELYQECPPHKHKQNPSMFSMMDAQSADADNKKANDRIREMQEQWVAAKLVRMTYSKRQLLEVMTDFWYNHFNVDMQKDQDRWLFGPYERDVIRPLALGRFSDLLLATAQSPAMLIYLDNAKSTADLRYVPEFQKEKMLQAQERAEFQGKKKANSGLNENYGRELMELQTMGVDSGYTQNDVIEAARILTGWGIQGAEAKGRPDQPYVAPFSFVFHAHQHDEGEKTVLGHTYGPGGGISEGQDFLTMLAYQPATAHFLAFELCRRFISDKPSPALVRRVAQAYLNNGTEIRSTLMAIFNSPEFWDPANDHAKIKTPLEYVVSCLRATGADIQDPKKIDQILSAMGEPVYQCEPPTGYPETANAWVSSSALLARMNFGMLLFDPRRSPAPVDLSQLAPTNTDGQQILQALLKSLLHGDVSANTRQVLVEQLKDPEISHRLLDDKQGDWQVGKMAALILGSPEFQRR